MTASDILDIAGVGPTLSSAAMALILGVTEADIVRWWDEDRGVVTIPPAYLRRGRRRYREAAAKCGSDAIADVLDHMRESA